MILFPARLNPAPIYVNLSVFIGGAPTSTLFSAFSTCRDDELRIQYYVGFGLRLLLLESLHASRIKAVMDVLRSILRSGVSLARSVELTVQVIKNYSYWARVSGHS